MVERFLPGGRAELAGSQRGQSLLQSGSERRFSRTASPSAGRRRPFDCRFVFLERGTRSKLGRLLRIEELRLLLGLLPPSPTLIGSAGGFQINLVWDSSVASAPSGFESAIASAASYYTTLCSNKEVINIGVGYGKIDGTAMSNGALGESEALGYNLSYSMVASAMKTGASASSYAGKVNYVAQADASLPSTDPTHGGKFFVSEAETKALGLIPGGSASSSSLDGYISLSSSASYEFNQTATPGKYDAVGIAEHELSEVMGRSSSLGSIDGANEYTPLDLFRYSSSGARDLTPGTGYFSINNGATKLGTYNNPSNGGDAGDWASILSGDSYNAFMGAGTTSVVSPTDVLENAVLGYHLTAAGSNATQHLGLA